MNIFSGDGNEFLNEQKKTKLIYLAFDLYQLVVFEWHNFSFFQIIIINGINHKIMIMIKLVLIMIMMTE